MSDSPKSATSLLDRIERDSEREEKLVRVQLEMSPARIAELDRLQKLTGARTRRELFDNALTLFERAVAENQNGHRVAFIDEEDGRYKVVAMPVLDAAFVPKKGSGQT